MKINKHSRWLVMLVVLSASFAVLFTQVDSVRATFSNFHVGMVLLRVETEILQKSPAGQYYEALFWKHNDELIELTYKYPEHRIEFSNVTRMFIPELEALLDGKGDTVYLSAEHMKSLETELVWFASVGSPALQEDIQRELQRFPLAQFVGMTMNEAQDFVNSNWTSDSIIEKILVPDSKGEWAYYIHNGVYLEYPSSYNLQISDAQKDFIYFIPSADTPEYWDSYVMKVHTYNIFPSEKEYYSPRSWYSPESILSETDVKNIEFPGFYFATIDPAYPISHLHAFLYNEANQMAVHIMVLVYGSPYSNNTLENLGMAGQRYEYFQHMIDSLKIQVP